MSLFQLPAGQSLDAFIGALSDDEALSLERAIAALEQIDRYAHVVSTFPKLGGWPPDYAAVEAWRAATAAALERDPELAAGAKGFYRTHIADFIDHWCVTYDPRNAGRKLANGQPMPAKMPFIQFQRQREMAAFLLACIEAEENGLLEKCRDMGATWEACAFSVGLWLFWPGAAIGWGSRKEQLVDKIGDPDSIFEKMRMIVRSLPGPLLPVGFSENDDMAYMKFINPETEATITGEAGKNIGRGGRKLIYFKDESAHYDQPESIEAALADNTRVQIDISSVNGLGNVFHRRREAGYEWKPGMALIPGRTAVFIMDWRDHPAKTQAWYDQRRQKAIDDGLLHVFAQEVDRSYAASVEGTIIDAEWVKAAIGARERLGIPDRGMWRAALDVADGGGDVNALVLAKGIEIKSAETWGARDTGETARRAVDACAPLGFVDLQYDSVSVGSGVKAETNRLEEAGLLPHGLRLVPWNAGAKVEDPDEPIIAGDRDSPLNGDFYYNFKAQAWWRLRQRFERTYRAIKALEGGEPFTYDPDELISLDPNLPELRQIEKELSQPTAAKETRTQKLIVNKTPEGTRSPNLADAIVMAFSPKAGLMPVYPVAASDVSETPFKVPPHWKRAFAMRVEPTRVTALWGAFDEMGDTLHIVAEHSRTYAEAGTNALAIGARGKWIPGFMEVDGATTEEAKLVAASYSRFGLRILTAERRGRDGAVEPGISDMLQRISTGRMKVFMSCTGFFDEYRSYRRGEDGALLGGGLIDCARILNRPAALQAMIAKPPEKIIASTKLRNPYR